jgi:hypothetical protein
MIKRYFVADKRYSKSVFLLIFVTLILNFVTLILNFVTLICGKVTLILNFVTLDLGKCNAELQFFLPVGYKQNTCRLNRVERRERHIRLEVTDAPPASSDEASATAKTRRSKGTRGQIWALTHF